MQRYFISYSHQEKTDVELARFLERELSRAGREVFIDRQMSAGADWVAEIRKGIESCDCLVALLSQGAVDSEMIQSEIRLAHRHSQKHGKPKIVPIRIKFDEALDYELDAYLARRHQLSWSGEADSPRILTEILRCDGTVSAVSPSPKGSPHELPPLGAKPTPTVDPRAFSAPGGTLRPDDPFHIERSCDGLVLQRAALPGQTVIIKAPRQQGKSSLLLRYFSACREVGKKIVFIDFSVLTGLEMNDYPTFLGQIANLLRARLNKDAVVPQIEDHAEMNAFLEEELLPKAGGPLVLAFDEVDRILGRPFQLDFFTLLRMWHNERANYESPWEPVDLGLVISTEPYLLIDAADRSPFNVTPPVVLTSFSEDQSRELNSRYGAPLSASEVRELHGLLAGHPFLTRLAFYRLAAAGRLPFAELMRSAAADDGPFGDHLRALLFKVSTQPELIDALRDILSGSGMVRADDYHRLHGSGLVRQEHGSMVTSNRLYEAYFWRVLG